MIKQERDDCEDRRNARRRASPPSGWPRFQDRAAAAGSELSRQVPGDLEPDADLNEGRGAPGPWSSSLAVSRSNTLDRGTPPPQPPPPPPKKPRTPHSATAL